MAINVKIKQQQCEDNVENEVENIYTEQWSSIISDFKKKKKYRHMFICAYNFLERY